MTTLPQISEAGMYCDLRRNSHSRFIDNRRPIHELIIDLSNGTIPEPLRSLLLRKVEVSKCSKKRKRQINEPRK